MVEPLQLAPPYLIHGDGPTTMRTFPAGSIKLAYADPPFFTQRKHSGKLKTGETAKFEDNWSDISEYLGWLTELIESVHHVLSDDGSFFLHLDWRTSHHARIILDQVFGADQFRNEIIWSYRRWSKASKTLLRNHQTILWYSKTNVHQPNIPYVEYSPNTNIEQLWQKRTRNAEGNVVYQLDADGKPVSSGVKRGVPLGDVWDIPVLNPLAKERVGYPTQKPIELLERIIEIGSNPGDIVIDPCCGSGTTIVAASLHGRKHVGIDISENAINVTAERLMNPVRTLSKVKRTKREKGATEDRFGEFSQVVPMNRLSQSRFADGMVTPDGLQHIGLDPQCVVAVDLTGDTSDERMSALQRHCASKHIDLLIVMNSDVTSPLYRRRYPNLLALGKVTDTDELINLIIQSAKVSPKVGRIIEK